jgi:hypothetical protein
VDHRPGRYGGQFHDPCRYLLTPLSLLAQMRAFHGARSGFRQLAGIPVLTSPLALTRSARRCFRKRSGNAGEPVEVFPFLGSSRLAETIDRFEVSLVLHGHAHNGAYKGSTRKGIPVYNCTLSVAKPEGRPYALLEI